MSIDEAKALISDRYLGVAGIHGVGLRRRDGQVVLYVSDEHSPELLRRTLPEIEQRVQPVRVVLRAADRPQQMGE
jgi:hypothetical protein